VSACAIAGSDTTTQEQALGGGKANIDLTHSNAELLQTSDTPWTLAKTGTVDSAQATVTWTITATPGTTVGGHLVIDGYLRVRNSGSGPATIGNIVVNLQVRQNGHWVTKSSDIADATHNDAATHAYVVAAATSDNVSQFTENSASGHLFFLDRMSNSVFSLVPEVTVPPHTSIPLLFSASYDNTVLGLAVGTQARAEILVSFGNHPAGQNTANNVDINGNGVIDPDEAKVKTVSERIAKSVPATRAGNATVALSDAAADITTTGTVTFSNPVFVLGATSGTVTVTYSAGASGGSITNCAHADGSGITDQVGEFQYPIVAPFHADACNTQPIHPACVDGAPGCGWKDGDMITLTQSDWGDSVAGEDLVLANYDTVYAPFSVFQVGGGFTITFGDAADLLTYLPAIGAVGPLDSNLLDPTSSSSGAFGGDVSALKLNVDFSDAGLVHGTSSARVGDLTVCGLAATPGFNGSNVRGVLAALNAALGGGAAAYPLTDLDDLAVQINAAFFGGAASTFAQQHLVVGACP
jgi:hypothetical protein